MKTPWWSAGLLLLAFAAGFLLYQAVIYVAGFLAAIAVPSSYFAWFGRGRAELAAAIVILTTMALPMAILFAGGTLASYRLLRELPPRPFMLAIVAGAVTCFVFRTASSMLYLSELPREVQPVPISDVLWQILLPPWWAVPSAVAPWLGLAFAGWLILRRARHEA
ncbi:hypothetical protein [Piscinibacter sakaiensis]|uniref:hypothetical protein n=1 Tax=Piscinibacter sakaiensis TaxID=1547922 RepID=UPI003AAA7E9D